MLSRPGSLTNHLIEQEHIIIELEAHIEELTTSNTEWSQKYHKLKEKCSDVEFDVNELEQFKIENGKLQVELNNLRRNRKAEGMLAVEKLKEIDRILKYKL